MSTTQQTGGVMETPPSDTDSSADNPLDEEKQAGLPNPSINHLVEWDGDNDPLNPRSMSVFRKWLIVTVVAMGSLLVTCASSIYASTYEQLEKDFHCSHEVAILGLSLFVVGLAIGPMVVSPLSEFYGRRPIYIVSMVFFLIFLIPSAAAQNIQTMLVGRFLDGFAGAAFLSVAAGTVADLFIPSHIQAPMMFYTFCPFIGPVLGPALGGFINQFTSWRWTFYVLIIWTAVTLVCTVLTPETFHPVLLAKKAASIRKKKNDQEYHSASELAMADKTISSAILRSLYRPFQLLLLEPMCFVLCIYSALLLGILYLFFGAFPLVFRTNHGFELWQTGLTFMGLVVGNSLGVLSNPFWHKNYLRLVANSKKGAGEGAGEGEADKKPDPELRLPPAIAGGVMVPISLFWFAWTTYSSVHWIVPIIASVFFGSGILLTFSGIWTFLVDAYPKYAASALAANVFVRCMFAAAFPLFGEQMYNKLGYQWASSLLAFLALAMMPFPYLFYRYGRVLRAKSRFASA